MRRLVGLSLLLLVLGSPRAAVAQDAPPDEVQVRKITPADEPDPALRYQFWPPVNQRRAVDAMPTFSQAVLMLAEMGVAEEEQRFSYERQQQWTSDEWNDEYAEEIETFLAQYQHIFRELERATDCMIVSNPRATEQRSVTETVLLLMPEIQRSRELSRLLRKRAHLEMHTGRWDEFARTMQTMFRLADVMGQSNELLIGRLVSFAITGSAHRAIEEAVSVPGSPNFYWALAAVPPSLFKIRDAIDREVFGILRVVPQLANLPDDPIGPGRSRQMLREVITSVVQLLSSTSIDADESDPATGPLMAGMAAVTLAAPSKQYLRERTDWGSRADDLSNSEAVLRVMSIQLRRATGDFAKWSWLPRSIRSQYLHRSSESVKTPSVGFSGIITPAVLISLLLPATEAANAAALRIEQEHASLATVETVRMAAANTGELPESIDNLVPPIWPDPLREDAFGYRRLSPTSARITRGKYVSGDPRAVFELKLVP